MKIEIPSRDITSSLSLLSVLSYLKSDGWYKLGPWGDLAVIYAKEIGGREWQVLLPLGDSLSDYADVMERLVSVLSQAEERSELEVFTDLANISSDVIRLASTNGFSATAMSLTASSELYRDARDLLANAARATEQPKASYAGRFSGDVSEYLNTVVPVAGHRSGHSLTLQSPVPPSLSGQIGFDTNNQDSFSRKTVATLATALKETGKLIERTFFEDSTPDDYDEAISVGVSTNLCENVASLARSAHGIEIAIRWAPINPAKPINLPFRFTQHSAEVLREVARDMRRKQPSYDEQITAYVWKLEREPRKFDGKAVIIADWQRRPTQMNVKFDRSAYQSVVDAFSDQSRISLQGDIHPSSRRFELRNPRNLKVHADHSQAA